MRNETTYYINEEMLGSEGTETQARWMVEYLSGLGYNVEYGEAIGQDAETVADADWLAGLETMAAESVE